MYPPQGNVNAYKKLNAGTGQYDYCLMIDGQEIVLASSL